MGLITCRIHTQSLLETWGKLWGQNWFEIILRRRSTRAAWVSTPASTGYQSRCFVLFLEALSTLHSIVGDWNRDKCRTRHGTPCHSCLTVAGNLYGKEEPWEACFTGDYRIKYYAASLHSTYKNETWGNTSAGWSNWGELHFKLCSIFYTSGLLSSGMWGYVVWYKFIDFSEWSVTYICREKVK
jgi:hypothetical protein